MLLGPVVKGYASGGCFGGLGTSHPPPERDFRLWEDFMSTKPYEPPVSHLVRLRDHAPGVLLDGVVKGIGRPT